MQTEGRIAILRSPFIFANFNGTFHDVELVTHETGHAFTGFLNRDRIPSSTIWPSMEGCEVHSMSMEFFARPWAEAFFGEDPKAAFDTYLNYSRLGGTLTFTELLEQAGLGDPFDEETLRRGAFRLTFFHR